jgi:5-methylcytosine-specific restriction enzyme A
MIIASVLWEDDHVAVTLEEEWAQYLDLETPQEILEAGTFVEGSTKQITVNIYERSRGSAKRCVDHYGHDCSFNFAQSYDDVGESFIHVYHLKPLSEVASGYKVDPIQYLRIVCPNCHAVIHRRDPPYSIEELRGLLDE